MRVSIVFADKVVCIDGVCHNVHMPEMPADLHAVQWYGTSGEEERVNEIGRMQSNDVITSFESYQWAITAWNEAHDLWLAEQGITP